MNKVVKTLLEYVLLVASAILFILWLQPDSAVKEEVVATVKRYTLVEEQIKTRCTWAYDEHGKIYEELKCVSTEGERHE